MTDPLPTHGRLNAKNPYVGFFKHAPRGQDPYANRVVSIHIMLNVFENFFDRESPNKFFFPTMLNTGLNLGRVINQYALYI